MIVLDGDKLRDFWDNIARGFEKSPLEALISIVVIILLVAVPVALFLMKQRKEREKKRDRAREVFEAYTLKRKLSEADRDLLLEMCRQLPKGEIELPNLVTKPATFNTGVKRLIESGQASDARIARLRLKLGLVQPIARGILHSTAEFYQGMPVQITLNNDRKVYGRVIEVEPDGFSLEVPQQLARGSLVELRIRRPTGLYSLTTTVTGQKGSIYRLQHSERIRRVQKRLFFRRALRLPVIIATDDPSRGIFKTRLLDLSAGGAKIRNPGMQVKVGESIHLKIFPTGGEPIRLSSHITRIASGPATLSVAFDSLKDSIRDQIMKLVFS
jgi:hypothetical protein